MYKPVKLIPVLFVQHRELTETFQTQSGLPLEVPGKKRPQGRILKYAQHKNKSH